MSHSHVLWLIFLVLTIWKKIFHILWFYAKIMLALCIEIV